LSATIRDWLFDILTKQRTEWLDPCPVPNTSRAEPSTAADALQRPLRFRFRVRLSASVRCLSP
jgi:hypothetical protein